MLKLQRYTDLTLRNNLINNSCLINYDKLSRSDMITRKRKCSRSISQFCIKFRQLKRLYLFFSLKLDGYRCFKFGQFFATIHCLSETVQCLLDGLRGSQNLIFFKFIIECAAADSEAAGSFAFVPITLFHDFHQKPFFVFKKVLR